MRIVIYAFQILGVMSSKKVAGIVIAMQKDHSSRIVMCKVVRLDILSICVHCAKEFIIFQGNANVAKDFLVCNVIIVRLDFMAIQIVKNVDVMKQVLYQIFTD